MGLMVTIQLWTAVSTQTKIYSQSFVEVKIAEAALKKGQSAGEPADLVQASGETMIDVLTNICNKIWKQENGRPHGLSY